MKGRRLDRQKKLGEEDYVIAKWAQEDVETLYNLLNNNKVYTTRIILAVFLALQI
jgi:hypothetical protein